MNIFRQLRWQLTLSYTIVTVGAFLVILLIMAGIVFTQIFIPNDFMSPEGIIESLSENTPPIWGYILSQSPVDKKLVYYWLLNSGDAWITSTDFLRIGAMRFSVGTTAFIRLLVIAADGSLLGTVRGGPLNYWIGRPFDSDQVPGLEAPLKAALAGETDASHLYTIFEPNERFLLAIPVIHRVGGEENQVVGAFVVMVDSFPTQADVPSHILSIAGRGLLIFILGVGIMGAIFGAVFAHGLAKRFKQLSTTTDLWSLGDFTRYIDDPTGDEVGKFAQRLNNMARQLQSLLRRRQDMAISEERNRLARDLHDSAKQQALAASFELGTALTLYERDPGGAIKHLVAADALVDAVRKELTDLVHELRPQPIEGQDFSEILKEHALEWSQRSGIEMNFDVKGSSELSLEIREILFRIAQEALANIARHSAANCAEVFLEYGTHTVTLLIQDDGCGFDTSAQHGGLGLYSMRERAETTGGSFTVDSAPGQGAHIKVTLPIE